MPNRNTRKLGIPTVFGQVIQRFKKAGYPSFLERYLSVGARLVLGYFPVLDGMLDGVSRYQDNRTGCVGLQRKARGNLAHHFPYLPASRRHKIM